MAMISESVSNQLDALVAISEKRFDMAFVDIRRGTESGITLLSKILEISPWLKVVMFTAHASIDSTVNISDHLAFDTAVSFTTNTNWQSYGGESTMSACSGRLVWRRNVRAFCTKKSILDVNSIDSIV